MLDTIDHSTLARLAAAGAVHGAQIVGQSGGWMVRVQCGPTEPVLTAQRSQRVRLFRKFETLVAYLREVGIARFEVDAAHYDPSTPTRQRRPDRAAALQKAHEAAAYDTWFQAQVQASLDDPRASLGADEARQHLAAQREQLRRSTVAHSKA